GDRAAPPSLHRRRVRADDRGGCPGGGRPCGTARGGSGRDEPDRYPPYELRQPHRQGRWAQPRRRLYPQRAEPDPALERRDAAARSGRLRRSRRQRADADRRRSAARDRSLRLHARQRSADQVAALCRRRYPRSLALRPRHRDDRAPYRAGRWSLHADRGRGSRSGARIDRDPRPHYPRQCDPAEGL
ncbi:MAG: hypothetical protein AVDCRST_MAG18-2420, partial [uncultured Thermomicrobiales bacterium]